MQCRLVKSLYLYYSLFKTCAIQSNNNGLNIPYNMNLSVITALFPENIGVFYSVVLPEKRLIDFDLEPCHAKTK